jgi:hypothetical protein
MQFPSWKLEIDAKLVAHLVHALKMPMDSEKKKFQSSIIAW